MAKPIAGWISSTHTATACPEMTDKAASLMAGAVRTGVQRFKGAVRPSISLAIKVRVAANTLAEA
jgi:hypothetical protein